MKVLSALIKVTLGLVLGCVIAEYAFARRDEGAFPHLNIYAPDAKLGTRLLPDQTMRIRVASNPVATVRTNSLGFRGPNWPAASEQDVLVVGDSQVFGLGVEDGETFSAELARLQKTPVLNAGVPTYGPREYTALVEQITKQRKIKTVIYVLNLANDLFEMDRPNRERHAIWDGWAVRKETAPAQVFDFPGRPWLMGRSHLVLALRTLLHGNASTSAAEELATEGTWRDLVQTSAHVEPPEPKDQATRRVLEERQRLGTALDGASETLNELLAERIVKNKRFAAAAAPLSPKGDPRDIINNRDTSGESSRGVDFTAFHLLMAAAGQAKNEALLEKLAETTKDKELVEVLKKRRSLRAELDATAPAPDKRSVTPLDDVLAHTKKICAAAGARLLVVALPLDVMVSSEEWQKYGVKPLDMAPTQVLTEDLVARAERLGIQAFDATNALKAAQPGAFLHGDLHMTKKGHVALAGAIAEALNTPRAVTSSLVLPSGRSYPPTPDEWRREKEIAVKGSSAAGCETKMIREWVRILCRTVLDEDNQDYGEETIHSVDLREGGHGDARWSNSSEEFSSMLVLPFLEGDTVRAAFRWNTSARELVLKWPKGQERTLAFGAARKGLSYPDETLAQMTREEREYENPLNDPTCDDGMLPFGAMRRCALPCSVDAPCTDGLRCEPWGAAGFCTKP